MEKKTTYFCEPGRENTEEVLNAVLNRIREGDIDTIIVASTTGSTGRRFTEVFKDLADVIVVGTGVSSKHKSEIDRLGGRVLDTPDRPFRAGGPLDLVRNSYFALGQGFKVAVEIILLATGHKIVAPSIDVVSVGGSNVGADTAIVARTSTSADAFGRDKRKKMEIREIVAMPLKKQWW